MMETTFIDFLKGFLYGLSIALNLFYIIMVMKKK